MSFQFGKYQSVAVACALSAATVLLCGLAHSLSVLALARFACGLTAAWIARVIGLSAATIAVGANSTAVLRP